MTHDPALPEPLVLRDVRRKHSDEPAEKLTVPQMKDRTVCPKCRMAVFNCWWDIHECIGSRRGF